MLRQGSKLIAWLWMITLLTASVGVSVQQVYCYCIGKSTYAVFDAPVECALKQATHPGNCCKPGNCHEGKSCCEKSTHTQPSKGCTKKSSQYFQLKTEYTLGAKSFDLVKAPVILQHALLPEYPALGFVTDNPGTGFQSFAQPPPPLPGRMICLRHRVFRC